MDYYTQESVQSTITPKARKKSTGSITNKSKLSKTAGHNLKDFLNKGSPKQTSGVKFIKK